MSESATHDAIEALARNSYGRLIAFLVARSGDVAGAEDALSEAFVAALEKWPAGGIPEKPEAWLVCVARNRLIDAARHTQVRQESEEVLKQIAEEAQTVAEAREHFPDERLKLLFVCAHPAIDPAARTPLMLQTVLGTKPCVDRERIGVIGVCGSGSFGLAAAETDPRIKAVATVSMYDIGQAKRQGLAGNVRHGRAKTVFGRNCEATFG